MKRQIFIIGLILFYMCACNTNRNEQKVSDEALYFSNKYCPDCDLGLITDPNTIVSALSHDSTHVYEKHIGITGTYSREYACYERLRDISSDSTLIRITHHTNPVIRTYAMWALTTNNKQMAIKELPRFKEDQASVLYSSGCTTIQLPISYLVSCKIDSIIPLEGIKSQIKVKNPII